MRDGMGQWSGPSTEMGWQMGMPMPIIVGLLLLAITVAGLIVLIFLLRRPVSAAQAHRMLQPNLAARSAGAGANFSVDSSPTEADLYLVIPDISGYTEFLTLSRFSLAHAQYLVSELLESIIAHAEPLLRTAKVEGDAVFLYGFRGTPSGIRGPDLGNIIAEVVQGFYRRRSQLEEENACKCVACKNLNSLDLKIIIHSGSVLFYGLHGAQELSGIPVILAHRLLKNSVRSRRYILITEEAHEAVSLPFAVPAAAHSEHYEGIGQVQAHVYEFDPTRFAEGLEKASTMTARTRDAVVKLRQGLKGLGKVETGV